MKWTTPRIIRTESWPAKNTPIAPKLWPSSRRSCPSSTTNLPRTSATSKTLDELRAKVRQELEKEVDQRHSAAVQRRRAGKNCRRSRFPGPRGAGGKPDGRAPGARRADFSRPGSRSPRGQRGLGGHAPPPASIAPSKTSKPSCCSIASLPPKILKPPTKIPTARSPGSPSVVANRYQLFAPA